MKKVLVVTGSARPNSVNSVVTQAVIDELAQREGVEAVKADLVQLDLPYMSGAYAPSHPKYTIEDPKALEWQRMVTEADGIVFVAPEYNHSLSAIQKNAIDWLYKEWNDKPAVFVGYGAYAAKHSYAHFLEVNTVVKMKLGETMTGIQLGEVIDWDGTVKDAEAMSQMLKATLDELIVAIS